MAAKSGLLDLVSDQARLALRAASVQSLALDRLVIHDVGSTMVLPEQFRIECALSAALLGESIPQINKVS